MILLSAISGAVVALAVREFVEWRMRITAKQASCYHDFYETKFHGYVTLHCKLCGYQIPKDEA